MAEIYIGSKDTKNKNNILEGRSYDVGTNVTITPSTFTDLLQINRNSSSLTRYNFEVKRFGVTENILDDYIVYLTNPEFLHNVVFSAEQANVLKLNINALSHVMYGDINLAWTIPFLNDLVKHPSDLTYELLTKDGLKAFNGKGVSALKELLTFKKINEENAGTTQDKEPLFNLDAY